MGEEIKGITAKEARKLADSSDYAIKHIYKYIRERANENATVLDWCICDLSGAALEHIIAGLIEDGFKVDVQKKTNTLHISW